MATRQQKRQTQRKDRKPPVQKGPPKGKPVLRVLILDWQLHYYDKEGRLTGMTGPPNSQPIAIPEAEFPLGIEKYLREKGFLK
jgi:hypothetical protein